MEVKESYYEILDISTEATEDDVRKAYRRQALLWHPDKNAHRREEAEARFKMISEAYEVLSDADKRKIYDLYGEEGLKNGGPTFETRTGPQFGHFQFHDPNEIFRRFFEASDIFGDPFFSDPFGSRSRLFGVFPEPTFGSSMSSTTFVSTSSSFGGSGGYKKSTSTQIVNGVRTTVTRTEDPHGNVTEEITSSDATGHLGNNAPQHFIQDSYSTQRSIPIQEGNIYYNPIIQQHQRGFPPISRSQHHYESQQRSSRHIPSEESTSASNFRENDAGTRPRRFFPWGN